MFRILVLLLALSAWGCGESTGPSTPDAPGSAKAQGAPAKQVVTKAKETVAKAEAEKPSLPLKARTLVVYSGRGAGLVEPLLEMFEKRTGITLKTRFDKSTQTLANRIAVEGAQTEADVFFAQDSGYLGALADAGMLAPLPQTVLGRVAPEYRDPKGFWVGTSGRARVLVYSPERVKKEDLPTSLAGLAHARWRGRMGWAPSNSSFQAHISALRSVWGEGKTRAWLNSVVSNEPKVYPKNSPQVKAVSNGEIDVGWVNHYYLHKLKAANPQLKAANHSFSEAGDAGNLMMLSGVAIIKDSKKQDFARQLAAFLVSDVAQQYFAQKTFEYPTVPGTANHPEVPPLRRGLLKVDQAALSDVANTVKLLRELEIL